MDGNLAMANQIVHMTEQDMAQLGDLIVVFTDGSCNNKPEHNYGGYAGIVLQMGDQYNLTGGEFPSTSARMELCAVAAALEFIKSRYKDAEVLLHTDAEYIARAFNDQWLLDWIRVGFANTKNSDLWIRICKAIQSKEIASFTIRHVRGHQGIYYNEMADKLAGGASKYMRWVKSSRKRNQFSQLHKEK